mgnify:CR=1 FL=1
MLDDSQAYKQMEYDQLCQLKCLLERDPTLIDRTLSAMLYGTTSGLGLDQFANLATNGCLLLQSHERTQNEITQGKRREAVLRGLLHLLLHLRGLRQGDCEYLV